MVGHFLWTLLRWPDGIIVGNLIASAIWAAPALWHLHRKLDRHHAQRAAERARIEAQLREVRKMLGQDHPD